jgi:hypothetical protein
MSSIKVYTGEEAALTSVDHVQNAVDYVDIGKALQARVFCTRPHGDCIAPPYIFNYDLCDVVQPIERDWTYYALNEIESHYNCQMGVPQNILRSQNFFFKTTVPLSAIEHIYDDHSIVDRSRNVYAKGRCMHKFKRSGGHKSVFLQQNLILPLILSTLRNPDKISWVSNDRKAVERRYDTEIGHSALGCCFVVRVVVEEECVGSINHILCTAFPTRAFNPSITPPPPKPKRPLPSQPKR